MHCKSADEIQAAIDSTAVPMPASIKKRAKERIVELQSYAAQGIEWDRPVMARDVREQRRAELEQSFQQRHPDIKVRDDSKNCDAYLRLTRRDDAKLAEVTDVMHEMWFLFNHTDYNAIQSTRCGEAQRKRDERRERLGRDYEFGFRGDWVDYNEIRETSKGEAVRQYVKRVGKNNLPAFFPPTMRHWT